MLKLSPMKRKIPKNAEPATPGDCLSSRRIVLLGNTGVGKSASGNRILGRRLFRSERSTRSVTSECSVKHTTVSGRSVSVVDTPGFFQTNINPDKLMTEIARSVYITCPGPHAFLIVFPVGRSTEQEQQIPQMIKTLFGHELLKYSIILFTHGDLLDGESVEELVTKSSRLRRLVDQCGGRYHVFNNRDQDNREQVNDLLQKIDSMIEQNGGGHYSHQMYEDNAQTIRQEEEERRLREEEEMREREEEEMREREEEEMREREEEEMREREEEEMREREEEEMREREEEEMREREEEEEMREREERKRRLREEEEMRERDEEQIEQQNETCVCS